jgi:hypothetical protein
MYVILGKKKSGIGSITGLKLGGDQANDRSTD